MGKVRKSTSKRCTLRKKYSVDKKVKDHKKKLKKEIRKMKKGGILKKPLQKIPGIPNKFPFKGEMLDEAEKKEQLDAEMKEYNKLLKSSQTSLPKGTFGSYAEKMSNNAKVL